MDKTGVFRGDPGLLVAFREGGREALERVYRGHAPSMERYLRGLGRGSGIAELGQASVVADLLQEVFIRAFSDDARRAYDGIRDYAGYLTAIARNCFIDLLRSRGREVLTDPEDLPFDADVGADAEQAYDPCVRAVLAAYLADLRASLWSVYEQ